MPIVIETEDVKPYIYFVCSMAQRGPMYGGLGSRSDYMGGIFDRWINIIPESVIFNKHLLQKEDFLQELSAENTENAIEVISDYYVYDPARVGIAPDVLGIRIGAKKIPFVEFNEGWHALSGAPQIEVKSFKKDQYMVNLRDQGYDTKYLVMVETSLQSDYLLPFFREEALSEEVYERLEMDDDLFIRENREGYLTATTRIGPSTTLGTLKLIRVCSATDFMRCANKCLGQENPTYVKSIVEGKQAPNGERKCLSSFLSKNEDSKLYSWNSQFSMKNPQNKLLDVHVENLENIDYLKHSNSSITICTKGQAKLNNIKLEGEKVYRIELGTLIRSNQNTEYFMNKSVIEKLPDAENDLLQHIAGYINQYGAA